MHWLRFAVLVLTVTVLQTGLVDIVAVTTAEVKPDLLLILLVFFAIYSDPAEAVITSFTIGFAADIIGPTMGPRIISFGLVGTLLADLHGFMAIRRIHYQSVTIFITGFITAAMVYLLTLLKAEAVTSNTYVGLVWTPLYSAILGPFLFLPLAWWMRMKRGRK